MWFPSSLTNLIPKWVQALPSHAETSIVRHLQPNSVLCVKVWVILHRFSTARSRKKLNEACCPSNACLHYESRENYKLINI
jgi:hypothetical protein